MTDTGKNSYSSLHWDLDLLPGEGDCASASWLTCWLTFPGKPMSVLNWAISHKDALYQHWIPVTTQIHIQSFLKELLSQEVALSLFLPNLLSQGDF